MSKIKRPQTKSSRQSHRSENWETMNYANSDQSLSTGTLLFVLSIVAIFSVAGCGGKSKSELAIEKVHSEIKVVYERFKRAGEEDDLPTLFETSSRETVKRMIFEAVLAMGSTAKSVESEAILARYIDEEKLRKIGDALETPDRQKIMELYMLCITDHKGMFVDSYTYLKRVNPDQPKPKFGDLSEIKVTGDVAIAKTTATLADGQTKADDKGESGEDESINAYFIRVDGKWKYATKAEWTGDAPK